MSDDQTSTASRPILRRGTLDDARACHDILWASITDFARRHGTPLEGSAEDWWKTGESLHRLLATEAAEWWVAEDEAPGAIVGYARSIDRNGLFELTEFFVRPGRQSAGIGRELIERAFPHGRGEVRAIVAVPDVRALSRYYRAGTASRCTVLTLAGSPSASPPTDDLIAAPIASESDIAAVAALDASVIGYRRSDAELAWLSANKEGYLYRRHGTTVGTAFIAKGSVGPILALDPGDQPAILRHVETRAAALGAETLELEVPSLNEVAVRHLLERGFRLNPWINHLMSDRPFGRFDRYICFSPPIVL